MAEIPHSYSTAQPSSGKRKERKKRAGLRQPGPKPVTENGPLMPKGPSRCSASLRAARSNRTASAAWSPNKSADRPNPSHFLPLPPHFSLVSGDGIRRRPEARRPWRRAGCARRRSVQQDESRALPRRTWPRRPCSWRIKGGRRGTPATVA